MSSLSPFSDEEPLDVYFCDPFPPQHHGGIMFDLFGPIRPILTQLPLQLLSRSNAVLIFQ